jgi:phosphohistidine phosphatase
MELYLLRHGIAVEPGTRGFEDDFSRPLTPKGRRQLRKNTAAIKELAGKFDLILSSPLVRAKQTAEIVAKALDSKKRLRFTSALGPGGAAAILVRQLEREKPAPEKVLLVGHEPDMSRLVSLLTSGRPDMQIDFKKGALCKLETEKLTAGQCARLIWLVTPKQMKLIG